MKTSKAMRWIAVCMLTVIAFTLAAGCSSAPPSPTVAPTVAATEQPTATAEASAAATTAPATSAAATESAALKRIKEQGYILIGSSNDAPFSYQDVNTNELKGVDIEILREICKRLGIPDIKMKVIDFSNLLVELNNNSIDMVVDAMYVKDVRLQVAAFTDKWYQEGEAVVIPADSAIASKDDLKGKTIGAQPGTTFYDTAKAWLDAGKIGKLQTFDNQAMLMTAVNMGKVDAVITDGIVAGYTLASDSSLKLKLLTPYAPEASGKIGAAVRFTDEDFLVEVNKCLNDMKTDGTLMKILKNYGLTEDYFVGVDDGKTANVK